MVRVDEASSPAVCDPLSWRLATSELPRIKSGREGETMPVGCSRLRPLSGAVGAPNMGMPPGVGARPAEGSSVDAAGAPLLCSVGGALEGEDLDPSVCTGRTLGDCESEVEVADETRSRGDVSVVTLLSAKELSRDSRPAASSSTDMASLRLDLSTSSSSFSLAPMSRRWSLLPGCVLLSRRE